MKKAVSFILILTLLLVSSACGSAANEISNISPDDFDESTEQIKAFSDDPDAITAASESVVMISVYDANNELIATGSGFPLFESGTIITNYHVIKGGVFFEANTESETYFKIDSIVAVDADRDIAILHTNAKTGFEIFTAGDTSALKKGEKVIAIGSPLGLINTVSDGLYSNNRSEDGNEYLQFTAPISHGSSGGALFNDSGEVIGITSASYVDGQNLNLAIPIEAVINLWERRDEEGINRTDSDDEFGVAFEKIVIENAFDFDAIRKEHLALIDYYESDSVISDSLWAIIRKYKNDIIVLQSDKHAITEKMSLTTAPDVIAYFKAMADSYDCLLELNSSFGYFAGDDELLNYLDVERRTANAYMTIIQELKDEFDNADYFTTGSYIVVFSTEVPCSYTVNCSITTSYKIGSEKRTKKLNYERKVSNPSSEWTAIIGGVTGATPKDFKISSVSWQISNLKIRNE